MMRQAWIDQGRCIRSQAMCSAGVSRTTVYARKKPLLVDETGVWSFSQHHS